MKTSPFKILLSTAFVVGLMVSFTSCKSAKNLINGGGEVELNVPCSGPEFFTNKDYFRASAFGESQDQMLAKKKALASARDELASSIEVTVKGVTDNYLSSREVANVEEAKERFETISRQVVNQKLNGIRTICEKYTKTVAGNYKCYVSIELAGNEIMDGMKERLSNDEQLKLDFEYEKFKGELEKEMENYGR